MVASQTSSAPNIPDDDAAWPGWRDLSPLEVLMSHRDNPNQPMVITALFGFESALPDDWVESVFAARVAHHPRFRATLATTFGRKRFVPLPTCDETRRVPPGVVHTEAPVDAAASPEERVAAFRARVDALASTPLPMDQPLWAIHHFPGFVRDAPASTDASTILLRVHHCVGDGVSLVKYCFKYVADGKTEVDGVRPEIQQPRRETEQRVVRSFCSSPRVAFSRVYQYMSDVANTFTGPFIPDATTVYSAGLLGKQKFMNFAPEIPLADVKAVSKELGFTVNTVLSACVTAAVREYMLRHGGRDKLPAASQLHAVLAFNMHVVGSTGVTLSNKVALLPIGLRVAEEDPDIRLQMVADDTNAVKVGSRPALTVAAFKVLELLPEVIRRPLWRHMTKSTTIVWTNVPGPREKVLISGKTLDSISVAAPADGHCGLVFTLFSYAGQCSLCVSGDGARIKHPDELVALFMEEFNRLQNKRLRERSSAI